MTPYITKAGTPWLASLAGGVMLFFLFAPFASGLSIQSKIEDGPWSEQKAVYPIKGQSVQLRVNPVSGGDVAWYRIVPKTATLYHNAEWPWNPGAYQWLGFEKIDYAACEIPTWRGGWEVSLQSVPRLGDECGLAGYVSEHDRADVGSFWFQAVVKSTAGTISKTPGADAVGPQGLSPNVFRVSIREDARYLGYLTAFFNVPGLFGSTVYQSENFIGIDCADVLMAAYALSRGQKMSLNESVRSLVAKFPPHVRFDLTDGTPHRPVRWGKEIRPGDLIAVKYDGAKIHQHIGAFYQDANANGSLDGEDLVIHAGPAPLHISRFDEKSFDGEIAVLRLK